MIGVAVNARPQRGVGRIFAGHGVVADELDGEGVVVHQQLGRNVEVAFGSLPSEPPNLPGVGWMVAKSVPFRMSLRWLNCGMSEGEKA